MEFLHKFLNVIFKIKPFYTVVYSLLQKLQQSNWIRYLYARTIINCVAGLELANIKQFERKTRCQRCQDPLQVQKIGLQKLLLLYFWAFPESIKMIKERVIIYGMK